jgi:hypothetical protein
MTQMLAIAGGLVCVYIIFALIVAHVVELINAFLNTRGGTLYAGILEMLSAKRTTGVASLLGFVGRVVPSFLGRTNETPDSSIGKRLADGIYTHPLVGNLGMKRKPSYIDARTFTMSLIDALRDVQPLPAAAAPAAPGAPAAAAAAPAVPPLGATGDDLLDDLRARITALRAGNPGDPLARSLALIVEQAQNRYESVLKALDNWYDLQMQRVTGTFKRYATIWQIIIAAFVVYYFNVDTFSVVKQLNASTQLSAIATSTRGLAQLKDKDPSVATLLAPLKDSVTIGWADNNAKANGCPWTAPWHCWSYADANGGQVNHVPGFLITWFAVILGAPFWFDILKQLVPVRLSGAIPDPAAAARGDKQAAR